MTNDWKIVLLATICFVLGTSEFVIVGVLDKIAISSNITIAQAGQLISVFALTVAIGTPVIIYFTSRFNQKKILAVALALVVVSCILIVLSSSFFLLLLSRVVMALGVGVFNVLCFIIATKLADPQRKGRAVATVTMGFNAALIIGLPIGRIITGIFGWKAIFIFTSMLSFLSILMVLRFIPSFDGEPPTPFNKQLKLLKKSAIVLSLFTSLFWILGYSLLYSYITPYMQRTISSNERTLSITFLVFGIATLVGNKVGGYLGDKIGVSKTIIISLAVNAGALIILSSVSEYFLIAITILVLWGIAAWTPGPLFRYSIIGLAPEAPTVILSLYNSIMQMGMATGAAFGGFEIEHTPTITLSWTAAGIVFISLVFANFSLKSFRKSQLTVTSIQS
jgi:DHA1 family putative efflux transporter-like MFS transporter